MSTLQRAYWILWATFCILFGAAVGWTFAGLLGATLGAIVGVVAGTIIAFFGAEAIILILGFFSR